MIDLKIPGNIGTHLEPFVNAIDDPAMRADFMSIIDTLDQRYGSVQKAQGMELASLEDLVAIIGALQNQPIPVIYLFQEGGAEYFLVWIIIHDVYDKRGVPLVLYVSANNVNDARYIIYEQEKESIHFADKISHGIHDSALRIVRIKNLPDFLKVN